MVVACIPEPHTAKIIICTEDNITLNIYDKAVGFLDTPFPLTLLLTIDLDQSTS